MYNKKKIKVGDNVNGAFPVTTNAEANNDVSRTGSVTIVSTAGTRDSIDRSESIVSSSDNSSVILPAKVAATKVVTTDIQGSTDIETTAMQYVATSDPYASHHTSFPASLGITMSESSSEELDALCDKCWDSRTAAKIELEDKYGLFSNKPIGEDIKYRGGKQLRLICNGCDTFCITVRMKRMRVPGGEENMSKFFAIREKSCIDHVACDPGKIKYQLPPPPPPSANDEITTYNFDGSIHYAPPAPLKETAPISQPLKRRISISSHRGSLLLSKEREAAAARGAVTYPSPALQQAQQFLANNGISAYPRLTSADRTKYSIPSVPSSTAEQQQQDASALAPGQQQQQQSLAAAQRLTCPDSDSSDDEEDEMSSAMREIVSNSGSATVNSSSNNLPVSAGSAGSASTSVPANGIVHNGNMQHQQHQASVPLATSVHQHAHVPSHYLTQSNGANGLASGFPSHINPYTANYSTAASTVGGGPHMVSSSSSSSSSSASQQHHHHHMAAGGAGAGGAVVQRPAVKKPTQTGAASSYQKPVPGTVDEEAVLMRHWESRSDAKTDLETKFGLEVKKMITEDTKYRGGKQLRLICNGCDNFVITARLKRSRVPNSKDKVSRFVVIRSKTRLEHYSSQTAVNGHTVRVDCSNSATLKWSNNSNNNNNSGNNNTTNSNSNGGNLATSAVDSSSHNNVVLGTETLSSGVGGFVSGSNGDGNGVNGGARQDVALPPVPSMPVPSVAATATVVTTVPVVPAAHQHHSAGDEGMSAVSVVPAHLKPVEPIPGISATEAVSNQ